MGEVPLNLHRGTSLTGTPQRSGRRCLMALAWHWSHWPGMALEPLAWWASQPGRFSKGSNPVPLNHQGPSQRPMHPLRGQEFIFDPPQVLGSYVCPTVGAYSLLANRGIALRVWEGVCSQMRDTP